MVLPTIISEPAILKWNAFSYYFESGIKVDYQRATFDVASNIHGVVDKRMRHDLVVISGQPDGQVRSIAKYFPWAVSQVGKSLFGVASGGDSVVIHTITGKTFTWHRGTLTKMPSLRLNPTMPLFGPMEWTCLGKAATERTDAAYWKTAASAAFSDTTFDETSIKTAIYTAAYGSTPYDEIGSIGGFEMEIGMDVAQVPAVDIGIADLHLRSLVGSARFAPSNLTEEEVDTLMAMQGTGALQVGQSVAKSDTDLVIASDVFSATLHKAGPAGYGVVFETAKHKHEGIQFASKRTWTAGAANPLYTLEIL